VRRRTLIIALHCLLLSSILLAGSTAQRIVSTSPSITECLFALHLGPRVVGVSVHCSYPPEVTRLPKVGTYLQPDPEAIVRLRPDLVILEPISGTVANRLDDLHLRHLQVHNNTIEDLYQAIAQIGAAAGVPGNASVLVKHIQDSLHLTESKSSGLHRTRVLLIIGRRPGTLSDLVAVGPHNYLNRLIQIAGGTNVLDSSGLPPYPQISLETVIRADPEVILDLTGMDESREVRLNERQATEALWHERAQLRAVKANRVFEISSTAFIVPGPRVTDVAEMLFNYLHDGASQ